MVLLPIKIVIRHCCREKFCFNTNIKTSFHHLEWRFFTDMKCTTASVHTLFFALCLLTYPAVTYGEETAVPDQITQTTIRFNNDNWETLPHPRVADFSVQEDGSVIGSTEDGRSFIQFNIPNEYGVRVQRFEIDDHYHYIVGGTIAQSFTELSILLAASTQ